MSPSVIAALARSATEPVRIAFMGSSTTVGSNATAPENRWVDRFLAEAAIGFETYSAAYVAADPQVTIPGIWGYNLGISGSNTGTITPYVTTLRLDQLAVIQPHIVIHMIGSNDYALNMAPATYRTNLITKVGQIDAVCDVPPLHVMIHSYQRLDITTPAHPWSAYATQMQSAATAVGAVFLDINNAYVIRGVPGTDPLDLIHADDVHQTDAGHALMAAEVYKGLAVPPPVPPSPTSAAIPWPRLTDPNSVPNDLALLADSLNTHTNARFPTAAARDAAFPAAAIGQEATVAGAKQIYRPGGWEPMVNLEHVGGPLYGTNPGVHLRRDKTIHTNTVASSVGRFTVATGFTTGLLHARAWPLDAYQDVGQIIILRDFSTTSSVTFVAYKRSAPGSHHVGALRVGITLRGA